MAETIELKGRYEATETYSIDPLVGVRDNIVSPLECAYLINLAKPHIKRAGVVLDDGYKPSDGRTGSNHWLKYDEDDVVKAIGFRIADIVGLPIENAESMQIIHYGPEQEYRPHFDAFNLALPKGQRASKWGGQRLVTALVYLNNVSAGGATQFPKLGITVPARPGRMVIFHNTTHDISGPHPLSLHAGMPVEAGEKWAFNMWFRLQNITVEFEADGSLPNLVIGQSDNPISPHRLSKNDVQAQQTDQKRVLSPKKKPETRVSSAVAAGVTVQANRADTLWQQAANNLRRKKQVVPALYVSYWDTFGNQPQPEAPNDWVGKRFKTASRKVLNPLSDVGSVVAELTKTGKAQLVPATFTKTTETVAVGPKADDLWFIRSKLRNTKNRTLCVPTPIMMAATLPKNRLIQKAVDRLALIDQHKFTARIYLAIVEDQLYCADESILFVHGARYAPNDPNFASQVNNVSYHDRGSSIRVITGSQSPFSEALKKSSKALAESLQGLLSEIIADCAEGAFALLALDTLLTQANELKLLRIHTFPNFITSASIDTGVHIPLFEDVLSLMAGISPKGLRVITK